MKSYAFLFWAYNTIWVGIACYLLFVLMRVGRAERRLQALEDATSRKRST